MSSNIVSPRADAWFAGGRRLDYDLGTRTISADTAHLKVFVREEGEMTDAVTFLPGYPEGSFGWSGLIPHLPDARQMPKLFFDYVGMGDSDKPRDYAYSTAERADLVEALWRHLGVRSTTLVAFDFSSLVVLEHLRRRLERTGRGQPPAGPKIRGVLVFNGGLFTDGHSHPWYTTPLLRRLPRRAWNRLGRSFASFKRAMRVMWSKSFHPSDAAVGELYRVMQRHDGMFYLAAAAGFVADHKAQGKRLDFESLFNLYRDEFPFLIGGSEEDRFEHRQIDLAARRLGGTSLQIARLPGGHATTAEQPQALAQMIAAFERKSLQADPRPSPPTTQS